MVDFINRKQELELLSENITNNVRVTIIYSLHGRGKTSLIEHAFSSMHDIDFISISNEKLLSREYAEDFAYIKLIAENLVDELPISFSRKINNMLKMESVHVNFSLTAFFAGIGFDAPKKYKMLQSFIIKGLKKIKSKIYIHIEDMQKIDVPSLNFLAKLVNETDNVFLYLEYVIKGSNSIIIDSSSAYLKFNIHPKYIELESLDWEHVCNIFKNLNLTINNTTHKKYLKLNGDIKSLIFSCESNKRESIELNQDECFLINLIALASAEIELIDIYEIMYTYNSSYFKYTLGRLQNIINEMLAKEVIAEIGGQLYVTNLGMQYCTFKEKLLAINMLSQYYIPFIENDSNVLSTKVIRGLKILVAAFIDTNDKRIVKLLPYIKKYVLPLNYNKKIIEHFYKSIKDVSSNQELFYCLMQILIELGCYNEVLNLLEKNYINDSKYKMLYSIAIVHIRPKEARTEEIIKDFIEEEINEDYVSSLYTCLVAMYMKTKSSRHVIQYVNGIFHKNLITEQDKSIINKNISIYYDFNEAVNMIKHSISYFVKNKMERFTIASYITLSTRYAQQGKLKIAKKFLNILNKNMHLSQLDLIYIDNNLAVIEMCLDNFDEMVLENLINAYNCVEDEYTRMLAVNNLVVFNTIIKNYTSAKMYVDKIEEVGFKTYNFDEYLHISYVNLLFYYKAINNASKMQYYISKLEQLWLNCYSAELKKYIHKTTDNCPLTKNDKWYFMSKYKFRIAFMGHWLVGNFDV